MLYLETILSLKILYCYFAEAKHRKFSEQLEEQDLFIQVLEHILARLNAP